MVPPILPAVTKKKHRPELDPADIFEWLSTRYGWPPDVIAGLTWRQIFMYQKAQRSDDGDEPEREMIPARSFEDARRILAIINSAKGK